MVTGLGSIDANNLFTQWNAASNAVTVMLTASAVKGTLNSTVQLTATVAAASGPGTPTGTVSFSMVNGGQIGSSVLTAGAPRRPRLWLFRCMNSEALVRSP